MRFPTTNATLLEKLSQKDDKEKAWFAFFKNYRNSILDMARFKGLTDDEAEETLQNVMIKFHKTIEKNFAYDGSIAHFRTFLKSIIQNCIYDQLRLRYKNNVPEEYITDQDTTDDFFEMIFLEKWKKFLMLQAIEELKEILEPRTFQIFDLYVLQNCPPGQVSQMLNCSTSNIYTIKNRGISKLQEIIKRLNSEDKDLDLNIDLDV